MTLPKGQILWETIRDEKGRVKWAIASDPARTFYILYRVNGENTEFVKKAESPRVFEKYMGVRI